MAEVLEIQIQDKGGNTADHSGPPRPPTAGSWQGPAGAAAKPRPNDHPSTGKEISPGEGEKETHDKTLASWLTKQFAEVVASLKSTVSKGPAGLPLRLVDSLWQHQRQQPSAATAKVEPSAVAAPQPPRPPALDEARFPSAVARETVTPPATATGTASTGVAETVGGAEAVGGAEGIIGAVGGLDAATGGLATPLIVAAGAAAAAIGGAALAFDEGLHVATERVSLFGLKLSSAATELVKFSPEMSMANAMAEVRSTLDDFREAQETGADLARIAGAQSELQHDLREMFLPIKKIVVEVIAEVMEKLVELMPTIRDGFVELLEAAKAALELLNGMTLHLANLGGTVDAVKTRIDGIAKTLREIDLNTRKDAENQDLFLDWLHTNKVADATHASAKSRLPDGAREFGGPRAPLLDLFPNL
jgi:hypothetical protein